jgi:hypothetical protein
MFEFTCALCGSDDAGDTTHHGDIVYGGFGSAKFDETKLVWIGDAPDLSSSDRLCDDCVSHFVLEGRLEEFTNAMDDEVGITMSVAGYAAVFFMGADRFYAAICNARGSLPTATEEWDRARIAGMRCTLEFDPSEAHFVAGEEIVLGPKAYKLGRAHAAAAVLLNMASGTSPDFRDDARSFAIKLKAYEERAAKYNAEHSKEGQDLIDELLRDIGLDVDNGTE